MKSSIIMYDVSSFSIMLPVEMVVISNMDILLFTGQRLTTRPLCLPSDKALMCLSTELIISDSESLVKNIKGELAQPSEQ